MVKKIMLVDDVVTANFIMKKVIQKINPDLQIVEFTLPELAIEEVAIHNPDLIFLDINMPVINGWKFLELMSGYGLENKVYILSSSTSEFDKQQAKQYINVLGFLIKPPNLATVSKVLEEFFNPKPTELV